MTLYSSSIAAGTRVRPAARATRVVAMTLIEVIGVLAIVAILASVVLPALIRQTDKAVGDLESNTLQSFSDAIQRNIMRNRRIPTVAGNDWATNVASELGVDVVTVTNNVRRQPRVLLIDTNGFGTLTLPYTQGGTGTLVPADSSFNPRMLLVSSLGLALPSAVATGPLPRGDFDTLWSWDSIPGHFPTTGVWSGWNGNPSDIILQRLDLAKLMVNLWVSYNNAANRNSYNCLYAIDNSATNYITAAANTVHGYFFQNSVLSLYYTNPAVANGPLVQDSIQILNRDSSFVFDLNRWVNSLGNPTNLNVAGSGGSSSGPGGGTNGINNFDFSGLVNGFLAATATSLGPAGQTNVVQSFINYMSNYNNWANSNFTNNTAYNNALAAQSNLMSYVNNLVNNITVH